MSGEQSKHFHLPWHQYDHYWICVMTPGGGLPAALVQELKMAGMQVSGDMLVARAGQDWKKHWDVIFARLMTVAPDTVKVAVAPSDGTPMSQGALDWKSPVAVQHIAESLWLGDALLEDRILCYLQPVVSSRDKTVGYESFARARGADGNIIGGEKIILASRALGVEYMIDRHLHVQAITTFVCSDFDGFLFVNLFPGFIHRPAVYLEGLSEAAKSFGMLSKHVVLDFTRSETPHDIAHLKSICEYGRSRGYSIALDDIESVDGARKLIPDIRPDFVKIDMKLCRQADASPARETVTRIIELAHEAGATVIAEGIETEAMYGTLKSLGADLFQGYYFSPPVPVETVVDRSSTAAGT